MYNPKIWYDGDIVTSGGLNNIEQGIAQNAHDIEDLQGALDGDIESYVDGWLDSHPEATTTVQDGSLTYKKLVAGTLGYVSYDMFGAKLDGVSDDSAAVIAAHEFANDHGLPVIQRGGVLYLNFSVNVKTSCYLDMTMIMDDNSVSHAYRIQPDDVSTLTYSGTMQAGANGVTAPIAGLYGMSAVVTCENSTWSLGNREGTPSDAGQKWHTQLVAYDKQGNVISSGLYTENTGDFVFTNVQSLAMKAIEFSGPKVVTRFADNSVNFKTLVRCFRNNTVIRNISVENEGTTPNVQINNGGTLIALRYCANVIVENVNGLNHSDYPYPPATSNFSPYSYVYEAGICFNTTFRNINVNQGWGAGATFFVDNTYFENCNISRIDNHYGCFGNFIVRNCSFNGVSVVNLGYGNANVLIDGCRFHNVHRDDGRAVKSRSDFSNRFSGRLAIKNTIFDCSTADTPIYILFNAANTGNFPNNQPEIILDNVKHITPSTVEKAYTITTDVDTITSDSMAQNNRMMLYVTNSTINGIAMTWVGTLIMTNSVMPKASKVRASNMIISNSIIKTDEFPRVFRKDSTKGVCQISNCVFEFMASAYVVRQDALPMSIDNCTFVNAITVSGESGGMVFSTCKVPSAIVIGSTAQADPPVEYNTTVIEGLADMSIDDYIGR